MGAERNEGRDAATAGDAQQTLQKHHYAGEFAACLGEGGELSSWRKWHPVFVLLFVASLLLFWDLEGGLR